MPQRKRNLWFTGRKTEKKKTMLKGKQKNLPAALKKKIMASKSK